MNRNASEYPGLFSPDRTAYKHNRSFPQKREWFSDFRGKRIPPNVDAVGYPWLKLASGYALTQHSMPLLSADTTLVPHFWSGSYLTGEDVLMKVVIIWLIRFYGAVHCILCCRGLNITLSGFAFVTSPISMIMPWCIPSKISPHH